MDERQPYCINWRPAANTDGASCSAPCDDCNGDPNDGCATDLNTCPNVDGFGLICPGDELNGADLSIVDLSYTNLTSTWADPDPYTSGGTIHCNNTICPDGSVVSGTGGLLCTFPDSP